MARQNLRHEQILVEEQQAKNEEATDTVPDYFIDLIKDSFRQEYDAEKELNAMHASRQKIFNQLALEDPPASIFSKFTWKDLWGLAAISMLSVVLLAALNLILGSGSGSVSLDTEIDRTLVALEQLDERTIAEESAWDELIKELDSIEY